MKDVIILRGGPGNGKSTFASLYASLYPSAVICCADDYFIKDGVYFFDPKLLGYAHQRCRTKFQAAMEAEFPLIIIANTSIKRSERDFYVKAAKEMGYRVFSVILENLGTTNVHGVPLEKVEKIKEILKENIDL